MQLVIMNNACLVSFNVGLLVFMYAGSSLHLVRFGQLLRLADKRTVNIMKVTSKGTTCKYNFRR